MSRLGLCTAWHWSLCLAPSDSMYLFDAISHLLSDRVVNMHFFHAVNEMMWSISLNHEVYLFLGVLMKHTRLIFESDLCCQHVGMRLCLARVLQNNETGGLSRPRYPNRNGFRHPVGFTKKKDTLTPSFGDFLCFLEKWNQTFKLCWKEG